MSIAELHGKKIQDILVEHIIEVGGLDRAECFLILDNGLVIDIPWEDNTLEDKVWIKEITTQAKSIRQLLRNTFQNLLNQPIVDIIIYEEAIQFDKAFLELANGYLISEITLAPHGTGNAGLWYCESISALEMELGKEYKRLITK